MTCDEHRLVPIESLEAGALVLARGEDGARTAPRPVTGRWIHEHRPTVTVRLENGEDLRTTLEHRFFVEGRGFTAVGELAPGDALRTARNERVLVTNVVREGPVATVYNVSVGEFPTYFVGRTRVWVHNEKDNTPGDPHDNPNKPGDPDGGGEDRVV